MPSGWCASKATHKWRKQKSLLQKRKSSYVTFGNSKTRAMWVLVYYSCMCRLSYYQRRKPTKHYLQHKELARTFVHERVAYYTQVHGLECKRIAIRNTRKIWGSCSELGNLNCSYKIIFLPEHLAEYIIVHELCHLRHLPSAVPERSGFCRVPPCGTRPCRAAKPRGNISRKLEKFLLVEMGGIEPPSRRGSESASTKRSVL